jgi:probable HAF family extracellular repeat protein
MPVSFRVALVGVLSSCAFASAARGAVVPNFQGLGFLPGGNVPYSTAGAISRDGQTVVGTSTEGSNFSVFRWTPAGGMTAVGITRPTTSGDMAAGVSDDGSVIVGEHSVGFGGQRYAYRFTPGGGIQNLGTLPVPGNPGGETNSRATAVSADGSVVVGQSDGAGATGGWRYQAFRYTPAGGMQGLGYLSAGGTTSDAADVSADGQVVVGSSEYASTSNAYHAFRWTPTGGMVSLGDLPGGTDTSFAAAVSSDGNVVVGNSRSAGGREAFRWTQAGGMVGLGDLPGGTFDSYALDVSDNGVVVGVSNTTGGQSGFEAFIWDQANGMRRLQTVLEGQGLNLAGWTLTNVAGISADGTTLAGSGINPAGRAEAWVAVLVPEPGGMFVLVGSAAGLLARRRRAVR